MSDFYRYANFETEHFFSIEEASANRQQTIPPINHENFLCWAQFWVHVLNMFAEHIAPILDELLNPWDDLDP